MKPFHSEEELEDRLSEPYEEDIEALQNIEDPLLILGAGGKMGPTLAMRAQRALAMAGNRARVIAVSRSKRDLPGIEWVSCDLLEPGAMDTLPDAPNVVYMAARKFGSTGNPGLTWATNVLLAGLAVQRYRRSKIVAFSSGNVYPLVSVTSGGATEETELGPIGEYAQSVLGRERVFEHAAETWGTQSAFVRLNYAIEMRYGVLVDIARKVCDGRPVDLSMGYVNVIWQGDANSVTLRLLGHCATPPFPLNVTGPETLSVRQLALEFGRRFNKEAILSGQEAGSALLSNASRCHEMFGPPRAQVGEMMDCIAEWIESGGGSLGKPTHFEMREGKF